MLDTKPDKVVSTLNLFLLFVIPECSNPRSRTFIRKHDSKLEMNK
jgi:hypothetical protein